MEGTTRRIVRIGIDGLCLLTICVPTIVFKYGSIQPYRRGFYCNDESLNKPYKASTVGWNDTLITCVVLVTLMILLVELLQYFTAKNRDLLPGYPIGSVFFNDFFVKVYKYIGIYFFGLAFCMSFTDIGKFTIGRLRPHFLTVCLPNQTGWDTVLNCTGPIPGTWRYIEDDVCTGDPATVWEARQSFPSGHSAITWFAMLYCAIYLQVRMTWKFSVLLRHLLQACLLWMAFFTSLSRVSDYKHHPTDVLAGAALGILGTIFTIHWVPDLFGLPVRQDDEYVTTNKNGNRKISAIVHVPAKKLSRVSRDGFSMHVGEAEPKTELDDV
ncbi:phospholipid phosphatase 3-like [Lineus longissimus]|uniref:phospholipid phosphatase 3-like n=1 Tax=Lineus longissimus TaxID=88925 RepID=UPI002B4C57A3